MIAETGQRVERELGVGGMATVYLAEDLKHGRMVALKVLRPELSAAMGSERFPREIKTVAQFNHPHILSLYDSGEAEGFLYFVMPFVDGESLRDRLLREKQLPFGDAVRILREVVDALAYSHARGVVHRDIKPGNVLLSGRHAVVTDFGVAKAITAAGGDKTTTVGIAIGTPQYMAPEQAMGDAHIDHRADIYAIGILGYEMLAGRPPFAATTAQGILAAHVIEKPIDIRQTRPGTPPLLADAIMKCLEKNPADRWQRADERTSQLEAIGTTPSGGITPKDTRPPQAAKVAGARERGCLGGSTGGRAEGRFYRVLACYPKAFGGGHERRDPLSAQLRGLRWPAPTPARRGDRSSGKMTSRVGTAFQARTVLSAVAFRLRAGLLAG